MIKASIKDKTSLYYTAICDKCQKTISANGSEMKLKNELRKQGYFIKRNKIICKQCYET